MCVLEAGAEALTTELYIAYKAFCEEEGLPQYSVSAFGAVLNSMKLEKRKSDGKIMRVGIRMKSLSEIDPQPIDQFDDAAMMTGGAHVADPDDSVPH